jgi:hypothetical protein
VRSRAGDMPAQFTPETRDDVTGWLWEGPFATLIREAIRVSPVPICDGPVNTSTRAAWW